MNQIVAVGDSEDLVSVPIDHPDIDYDDLLEEFDYWSKLQNQYLERRWEDGQHHIVRSTADYVAHTDSAGSQMGSYLSPQTDHNSSLTSTLSLIQPWYNNKRSNKLSPVNVKRMMLLLKGNWQYD